MGYDMDIVNAKPEHPDGGYFRLNIFAMSHAAAVMVYAGMLTHTEFPAWPKPQDYNLTDDVWQWREDENEDEAPENVREFLKLYEATRDITPENPTGISDHKLASNDGWLVTEAELVAALATWDGLAEPHRRALVAQHYGTAPDHVAYFGRWIDFLRNASTSGGFRVW